MIALLPHCGFLSETSRMLAIGQALRERGVPVLFASHGGPYQRVIEDAGFTVHALAPAMDGERCARFITGLVQIGRPGVELQPADEVRASVASEVALFRRHGVQAAVIGFTLTAYLSTRVAGIPLATSHGGSFAVQASGTTQSLYGLWGSSASRVIAVGTNGTILTWNGSAWSPQVSGCSQNLNSIWGSGSTAWAVGPMGTILQYAP